MKKYSIITYGEEHTLPIQTSEGRTYIKFQKIASKDKKAFFDTSDKKMQEDIENSKLYKDGTIELFFDSEATAKNNPQDVEDPQDDTLANEDPQDVEDPQEDPQDDPLANEDPQDDPLANEDHQDVNNPQDDPQENAPVQEKQAEQTTVYAEVKTLQEAKEILKNTYSIHGLAINTPDKIKKKISELGLSFPNLVI